MNKKLIITYAGLGLAAYAAGRLVRQYEINKLNKELKCSLHVAEYLQAYLDEVNKFDDKFYKGET